MTIFVRLPFGHNLLFADTRVLVRRVSELREQLENIFKDRRAVITF